MADAFDKDELDDGNVFVTKKAVKTLCQKTPSFLGEEVVLGKTKQRSI